jgi:hypothetical protein
LAIWAPCYPPKELEKPYDLDIDAIIFSFSVPPWALARGSRSRRHGELKLTAAR